MAEFRVAFKPIGEAGTASGDWQKRRRRRQTIQLMRRRVDQWGGNEFYMENYGRAGGRIGPLTRKEVIEKLTARLPVMEVGEIEHVWAPLQGKVALIRKVKVKKPFLSVPLPSIAADWPEDSKKVWQFAMSHNGMEWWGSYNPRVTRHNPSLCSQHAYRKDPAHDFHPPNKATGDVVFGQIENNPPVKPGQFGPWNVVWWTVSHFDHGHVERRTHHSGCGPPCQNCTV